MPQDHGKLSVTIFWFREDSWEPTFISFSSSVSVSWKHVVKMYFLIKGHQCVLIIYKKLQIYVY